MSLHAVAVGLAVDMVITFCLGYFRVNSCIFVSFRFSHVLR